MADSALSIEQQRLRMANTQAAKPLGTRLWIKHAPWIMPLLTGLFYYGSAILGVRASIMSEGIAIFWPPNAVLLAALLLSSWRHWPLYALAIIPAEIAADLPVFTLSQALLFASINILEATLAASLLMFTVGVPVKFNQLRHVALFGLFALVIASGLAALLGAAVYVQTNDNDVAYWTNWRIWWFGDGLGLLIITPVLLGWLQVDGNPRLKLSWYRLEAGLLTLATSLMSLWVFSLPEYLTNHYPASPILLLPLTIWAASRFGVRGTATTNLLIAAISIYSTIDHRGPFVSMQETDNVLRLQEYLAALAFSSLGLAALLQELYQQNARLRLLDRAIASVNDGILITDARMDDNPIIYANPGFEQMTGYTLEEIMGQNPRFLHDPRSNADEVWKIRTAVRQRSQVKVVLGNRRRDGSLFYNQVTINPVPDEHGYISHFIGVQHDISELMEKKEALKAAHQALENINAELEQRIDERTRSLKQANEQLALLAATDPLTGVYNRRYFMDIADNELRLAIRHVRPLSVIALDIDYFKRINDSFGHSVGDKVLVMLAQMARGILRPGDVCARFGGEEFCILLPEASLEEAFAVAERLRIEIANLRVGCGGIDSFNFSVSLGVAERLDDEVKVTALLERADQALYAAKHSGRNRVYSAADL